MPDNRNTWFLAFILLALGAVALLGNSFPVILVLLGLLFLVRQFDNDSSSSNLSSSSQSYEYNQYEYEQPAEEEYDDYEIFHQQPASAEQRVYRHALESVSRAGLDPDNVQVLAVDIFVHFAPAFRYGTLVSYIVVSTLNTLVFSEYGGVYGLII